MTNELPFYVNDTPDPANWREAALAAGEEIAQTELVFHALAMMVVIAAMNDDLQLQELEQYIPEDVLKLAKEMANSNEVGVLGNSDQSPDAESIELQIPTDKPHLIWPLFIMPSFFQTQFLDAKGRDYETFFMMGEAIEKAEQRDLPVEILQKKIEVNTALAQFSDGFEERAKKMVLDIAGFDGDIDSLFLYTVLEAAVCDGHDLTSLSLKQWLNPYIIQEIRAYEEFSGEVPAAHFQ